MEIVHVVAINPYRKGNKGKVFSYNIDTYDKVIGSKEIRGCKLNCVKACS